MVPLELEKALAESGKKKSFKALPIMASGRALGELGSACPWLERVVEEVMKTRSRDGLGGCARGCGRKSSGLRLKRTRGRDGARCQMDS